MCIRDRATAVGSIQIKIQIIGGIENRGRDDVMTILK